MAELGFELAIPESEVRRATIKSLENEWVDNLKAAVYTFIMSLCSVKFRVTQLRWLICLSILNTGRVTTKGAFSKYNVYAKNDVPGIRAIWSDLSIFLTYPI